MVTKKVCLEQNISIGTHCMAQGHFMLHFTTFHNVSIYMKWPRKLLMIQLHLILWLCFSGLGEPTLFLTHWANLFGQFLGHESKTEVTQYHMEIVQKYV